MNDMKINKITARQRRYLFFLFDEVGLDNDVVRHDFIEEFTEGATPSMRELDFITARNMIRYLEECMRKSHTRKKEDDTLDTKRKGVIKAIYAYLEGAGIEVKNMEYVKSIAIRAAGIAPTGLISHDFNRIPARRLTAIYNEFCSREHIQKVRNSIPIICNN